MQGLPPGTTRHYTVMKNSWYEYCTTLYKYPLRWYEMVRDCREVRARVSPWYESREVPRGTVLYEMDKVDCIAQYAHISTVAILVPMWEVGTSTRILYECS